MTTKTQNKLSLLGQATLIVALLFATSAPAMTKAFKVNVRVRFVELQQASNWPQKFDWYPNGLEDHPLFAFTDTQFQAVLKALDQHDGADLWSDNQVTALSGRQVQLQPARNGATVNPTLDVVVNVSSDGLTIQTLLSSEITFLTSQDLPLLSRVRGMMNRSNVKYGQTLVLGGLSHNLLIFITPTVIDTSGNPIYSKDYYDDPRQK